jgi:hypothetical protein
MRKINVEAVYFADLGGMDKEHLSKVVEAPSLHKGEVAMAVAETHGVHYSKIEIFKWRKV